MCTSDNDVKIGQAVLRNSILIWKSYQSIWEKKFKKLNSDLRNWPRRQTEIVIYHIGVAFNLGQANNDVEGWVHFGICGINKSKNGFSCPSSETNRQEIGKKTAAEHKMTDSCPHLPRTVWSWCPGRWQPPAVRALRGVTTPPWRWSWGAPQHQSPAATCYNPAAGNFKRREVGRVVRLLHFA